MRMLKLLLVLAPFAVVAACGGKKPEMAEPAVPTTPDMSLDAGGLSDMMDSGSGSSTTATADSGSSMGSTDTSSMGMDSGSTTTAMAAVDAGAPDAGKGKGKGKGPKKK